MQTITKKTSRPRTNTANLTLPAPGLMSLPVIDVDALVGCYEQASHHLFLASNELKVSSAKTITQSMSLGLINEIDINREFKRHEDGEIVEIELLNTLTIKCENNLQSTCLSEDYMVDMDIEDGRCALTSYNIHEINIDTSSLMLDERALIYSSLEVISKYQLPLMPPNWSLSSTNSLIGEIIDNDEFEMLSTLAMKYESVDALVKFIHDDDSFEYFDYFLGLMNNCLSSCVSLILDYERMYQDCLTINKRMESLGLDLQSGAENMIKKHISLLKKYNSPESKSLLLVLNRLVNSKTYIQFERLEMEDSLPLDYSVSIIDAPYRDLIVHLQEQMVDELNQAGEPLREAIPFDDKTIKRFSLLTDAFNELNKLNKGK